MTGRGFLAWAMVALFTLALCGCETVKKIGEVIKTRIFRSVSWQTSLRR